MLKKHFLIFLKDWKNCITDTPPVCYETYPSFAQTGLFRFFDTSVVVSIFDDVIRQGNESLYMSDYGASLFESIPSWNSPEREAIS